MYLTTRNNLDQEAGGNSFLKRLVMLNKKFVLNGRGSSFLLI